ncbi:hypothetical protein JRO89_XS03G0054200 [Xanthoceras sorbifolium]|uniref:PI3K/PI4K catalytic domain-containing protein n=1 Tax=Xanthoceras sorbifolium TaxID=99658 RepID=A0ABQ8I8R6_9ROSI|nr:hypothetical protein JRO89_XS03G0054200 [Xanthoceras sorbifolium]
MYKFKGSGSCDDHSTAPPCIGWVEMIAPVFSRASWRCAWYMIQNDLIHAWGLDMQLGYCAQGDQAKNVGVVGSKYIVHLGLPTLGASTDEPELNTVGLALSYQEDYLPISEALAPSQSHGYDNRPENCVSEDINVWICRHLDNLLLRDDGRLFHVDFGYILGRDPKPFPPPMKLCKEMVEAMGGAERAKMIACSFLAANAIQGSNPIVVKHTTSSKAYFKSLPSHGGFKHS